MDKAYNVLLVISSLFFLYTLVHVILVVKFINSLSTILKNKYMSLSRSSIIIIVVSTILLLLSLCGLDYLFKLLLLILSMFLNIFNLSEIFVLKQYL